MHLLRVILLLPLLLLAAISQPARSVPLAHAAGGNRTLAMSDDAYYDSGQTLNYYMAGEITLTVNFSYNGGSTAYVSWETCQQVRSPAYIDWQGYPASNQAGCNWHDAYGHEIYDRVTVYPSGAATCASYTPWGYFSSYC